MLTASFMHQRYARTVALIIVVLGLAWTWISRPDAQQPEAETGSAARIGAPAPGLDLVTPSRQRIRLSDLRGQTVVLNFWASWCPPCKAEMPALELVHQQFKATGVVVLAINQMESEQTAADFMAANNLTFPVALDSDGMASRLYRVSALPTTYFIDKEGIIRDIVYGGPMTRALIESKVLSLER